MRCISINNAIIIFKHHVSIFTKEVVIFEIAGNAFRVGIFVLFISGCWLITVDFYYLSFRHFKNHFFR